MRRVEQEAAKNMELSKPLQIDIANEAAGPFRLGRKFPLPIGMGTEKGISTLLAFEYVLIPFSDSISILSNPQESIYLLAHVLRFRADNYRAFMKDTSKDRSIPIVPGQSFFYQGTQVDIESLKRPTDEWTQAAKTLFGYSYDAGINAFSPVGSGRYDFDRLYVKQGRASGWGKIVFEDYMQVKQAKIF